MYRISQESIKLLKQQIADLKTNATSEQQSMRAQLDQLVKAYDDLKTETHNHERELIQRLTVDHELEMNDVTKKLFAKDDEIITLKGEKEQLESDIKTLVDSNEKEKSELRNRVEELEIKLQAMEKKIQTQTAEKEAALKALKDDHRNEIESMRCKFKLMTSSKTSPSDMCSNVIDLETHQKILDDKKEEYERDLTIAVEKAVQEALERAKMSESSKWSLTASIPQASSPGRSPRDNQEIFKRILDEKDRQLKEMQEYVDQLINESNRLKDRIQNITDEDVVSKYKEKLEIITQEKEKLERELEKERAKRAKLSNLALNGGVTINSCSKDDIVLVVWNSVHEQYTVVQDSSVLYFLHAESYNDLKLTSVPANACPRICYCIGRVTDKEYCHAKKDENRYKVGKGTKFYRVKVRARSPSNRGDMERSGTERKKIKRSTGKKIIKNLI
jgi:RB1-inducible coiled-coil protein 1